MTDRIITAHLADPEHKLPMPGSARLFTADDAGEQFDGWDPFWMALIRDGSLIEGPRPQDRSLMSAAVEKPSLKVGDLVQWTSGGVDQFDEPRKVTAMLDDTHAQVEGSATGIPLAELHSA